MGILKHSSNYQNCIKSTNKIPEYARDYKNEWLFIRGINKEFEYFVDNIKVLNKCFFENKRVDTIIEYINKFLLLQERGKLKDISNFAISKYDIKNLIKTKLNFLKIKEYISCYNFFFDTNKKNIYPGFKDIYDCFELFFSKIKYIFEDRNSKFIYYNEIDNYSDDDDDIIYCDSESDGDYIDDNDVIEDELPIKSHSP